MNKNVAIALVVALVVSLMVVGVVSAAPCPPPLPSSFWGAVRIDGQNVPTGTEVSAWINGTRYAWMYSATYPGWGSVYWLDVAGDQCGTDPIEGGVYGDTINFKVGSYWANGTAPWRSGTNVHLDLSAYSQ